MQVATELSDIKSRIKHIIFETTNIEHDDIADEASFAGDLKLDSLTLLEIGVNIDQEYGLDLSEEEMKQLSTVQFSAELVREHLDAHGR